MSGDDRPGIGAEYRLFQQLALGKRRGEGVRPDTSFGRSSAHYDAEIIATAVRNRLQWGLAVWVAELARNMTAPHWDLGQPRLEPLEWSNRNHLGRYGRKQVIRSITYRAGGRERTRLEWYTPCRWVPSPEKIKTARLIYLNWWGALAVLYATLRTHRFQRFELVDRMPPMQPWLRKIGD